MSENIDQRRRNIARLTGLAYLGIIATGIFAEFVARGSLVVADDPTATAQNIADAPGLFSAGIVADLVMVGLDVTVAIGLLVLLQRVDRRLARAAAVLRLLQGAVIAVNLLHLFTALDAARAATVTGTVLAGPAQDALDAIDRHALGYDTGLIAFGLSCLVLGHLLRRSGLVSFPLAVGMSATGVVYLVGSFAALFAPSASAAIDPLYLIAMVVEPAFAIRLLRGLRTTRAASVQPMGVPA